MAQSKPTAFLFLDQRRIKKNSKYPLKLIVDYNGEKKSFSLPYDFTASEWKKFNSTRLKNEELKAAKEKLTKITGSKFNVAIKKIEDEGMGFNFSTFSEVFFQKGEKVKTNNDVYFAFDNRINELKELGRIGTAESYGLAQKALKDFKKTLRFQEITPMFLKTFEDYLIQKRGVSKTTVGIYMRALRAIINLAIHGNSNSIQIEYPFSQHMADGKYKIPIGNNLKKALSSEEIESLKNYKGKTESEQRALDFWLFSYYCNGINMKDLCELQYQNIFDEYIVFSRAKTAVTKKHTKTIRAFLHPEMKRIIKKWGNPDIAPDEYIFPILKKGISAEREHQLTKQFTRWVNKYLHNISEVLGFKQKISTYHARHSYATVMKRKNINIAYISDSLGHSDLKTTENYLAGFTDDTIEKNSNLL